MDQATSHCTHMRHNFRPKADGGTVGRRWLGNQDHMVNKLLCFIRLKAVANHPLQPPTLYDTLYGMFGHPDCLDKAQSSNGKLTPVSQAHAQGFKGPKQE
jgi:hypothetical protein